MRLGVSVSECIRVCVCVCVCVTVCFCFAGLLNLFPRPSFRLPLRQSVLSKEGPRQALPPQGNQVKPFGLRMWPEGQENLQGRSMPGGESRRVGHGGRMLAGAGHEEGGPEVCQVMALSWMPAHPHQPPPDR